MTRRHPQETLEHRPLLRVPYRVEIAARACRFRFVERFTSAGHVLPDFLIPGAQRSGSTSLYRYLTQHPLVLPAYRKEPHFFDRDANYGRGERWYRAHFPSAESLERRGRRLGRRAVTGEATPDYLYKPFALRRMAELLPPTTPLILILRDPVDRAYSHYQNDLVKGAQSESFEQAVERELARIEADAGGRKRGTSRGARGYLRRGIYVDQILDLKRIMPESPLLIVRAEDLFTDAVTICDELTRFLHLPPHDYQPRRVHNRLDYSEPMRPETRRRLIEFFAPHNARLYEHLGRDMNWQAP